ncbi:helix-turn-helix domain-containing protein [Algoriphagus lutimaris]|uniref:helix-turn-helix domain-containing protein n=1 Tax=Algoriphagus lutimaris TaxID=613197 RepID=UPI00196A6C41|nr:helix-turn-helix domain-containing protein [Algoriphagus lutimaris]MBN3520710.1 helix-turn-helix domain-containing protein [Algoriphagus lutimaris]
MSEIILTTKEELTGIINHSVKEALEKFRPIPKEEPKTESYYSRKETAKRLQTSLVSLRSWTKAGLIKSHVIGGRVLYKESDIEAALTEVKTVKF